MKRWFCLILAVLLIVPVLPIGAAAAEIYEFEYMYLPYTLNDSFDFVPGEGMFYYDGYLPDGLYNVFISGPDVFYSSLEPLSIVFTMMESDGIVADAFLSDFVISSSIGSFDSSITIVKGDFLGGTGILLGDSFFDVGYSVRLERVGDVSTSGDIGLSSFLESVKTGLIEYSTTNMVKIIVVALILACSPLLAWFGYRFLKHKVTKSVFKGRL